MFPGVNGFHWTFGHILFVSVFVTVLMIVGFTVLLAALRTRRALRKTPVETLRWKHDFEELPERDRRCRHELAGQVDERECPNAFDCRGCKDHARFPEPRVVAEPVAHGLNYAPSRLYHRGHTWVEPQQDGTVLVGLDDMAAHIVGQPDRVELPPSGSRLTANGTAWLMTKDGHDVRVLAPLDGEVAATGGPEDGFYLRVKPASDDWRHLLRGSEVSAWVGRELERLQIALLPAGAVPSLPDGGVLAHDLIAALPAANWDRILGEVFLEP
jgi:hypothetical protein